LKAEGALIVVRDVLIVDRELMNVDRELLNVDQRASIGAAVLITGGFYLTGRGKRVLRAILSHRARGASVSPVEGGSDGLRKTGAM
jgi:hypothetical protein